MRKPSYGDQDPIAAVATVPGESALAVIRTSGSCTTGSAGAIDLTATVFSGSAKLRKTPGNSIVHGWIKDPCTGKKIDEVLVCVYRSPKSYTGEDGVDISCHGGIAVVKAIMAALKTAGFREALPGEFTFRSFMNGKLDLTRAESVMEIVTAKTGRGREHAAARLSGSLEREINEIKILLVRVLAGTEIYLDYSEDEFFGSGNDEEEGRLPDREFAENALARLKNLSQLWKHERIYAEGALAVLAGRPNAGKSSIFNYLLREDRSIVTDIPGTTRDWIEALVSVRDIPLRLADTAGLRKPDSGSDDAEIMGIKRSLRLLEKADLVFYVIDGIAGITEEDLEFIKMQKTQTGEKPFLFIWNKIDLAKPPVSAKELLPGLLNVSAKTGEGIPELLSAAAELLENRFSGTIRQSDGFSSYYDTAGPGTLRQKELIDAALAAIWEALELSGREPLDIIAPLFRTAVNALGEITGEVSNADVLEMMFSRFCVGK